MAGEDTREAEEHAKDERLTEIKHELAAKPWPPGWSQARVTARTRTLENQIAKLGGRQPPHRLRGRSGDADDLSA